MEMSKEFDWPFEISGIGGAYEQKCRNMTKAGVIWLREHPEELAKWRKERHEYRNRTGRYYKPTCEYGQSHKAFESAIVKAYKGCTGEMIDASINHAISIFELGWNEYVNQVVANRKSEVGK